MVRNLLLTHGIHAILHECLDGIKKKTQMFGQNWEHWEQHLCFTKIFKFSKKMQHHQHPLPFPRFFHINQTGGFSTSWCMFCKDLGIPRICPEISSTIEVGRSMSWAGPAAEKGVWAFVVASKGRTKMDRTRMDITMIYIYTWFNMEDMYIYIYDYNIYIYVCGVI